MGSGKVAIPYYGSLYRARVGYERVYFIVKNGHAKEKDLDVSICVWDNKSEPTLSGWLEHNGIENLICREEPVKNIKDSIVGLGINVINGSDNNASRLMNSLLV
jgi:hypothetical protein